MAVVTVKSTAITAAEAGSLVNAALAGAHVESAVGIAAVANGDSIGSKYILGRVSSNARMSALSLFCTAITTCAGDVGLYQTAANGAAVVDADFFGAAQSLAAASAGINVLGGNVLGPANREKRIWEALGLSVDPQRQYDIVVTLTAAAASAGTIGIDSQSVL